MRIKIIRFSYSLGIILAISLASPYTWALDDSYVTDVFNINLHEEPSPESKVIAVLSSGEPLDIIVSDGDWSFVRLLERGDGNDRGFILSQYLISRLPWKMQAQPLIEENTELNEKFVRAERELREVLQQDQILNVNLQDNMAALNELQKGYEALEINAGDYLQLKTTYEEALTELAAAQEETQKLNEENKRLNSSLWTNLFVVEGLVLLFGLVIGLAVGRVEKKTRSLLHY